MTVRFKDHILAPGTLTARPAANTVPAGTLYPTTDDSKVYRSDGTAWAVWATLAGAALDAHLSDTTDAHDASAVSFAPTGNIAATDVQAAIAELDSEKAPAGHTHTGASTRTVNAQTGTSYTLALADAGAFVTMTNAAASTLTIPPNSSVAFPVGTVIEGAQLGAGQVTVTAGLGVTVNATPGLKVAAQYGTFGLLKVAADTWLAFGRLAA